DRYFAFTENVKKGTGNIIIKEDGIVTQTIDVNGSNIFVDGKYISLTPPSHFSGNKNISILITPGAFKDIAGNDFAGINDDTTWNFQTILDVTPPTLF